MDQLFASLAISGASLVGKAAFSIATNAAIKKLNSYIGDLGGSQGRGETGRRTRELQRLERKLEYQLAVVNPAMDLIDSLANRGTSGLNGIIRMSTSIRQALDNLEKEISSPESMAEALTELVQDLEDLVPFLQLCLQTMKSNESRESTSSVLSLKGALLAGHYLSSCSSTGSVNVGPSYQVRLYTLFHGSARKNSAVDWTWKEEFSRCQVQVRRFGNRHDFDYELCLAQDLNDGRYHEDTLNDEVQKDSGSLQNKQSGREEFPGIERVGKVLRVTMTSIRSLYYTTAGSLLRIEDCQEPALVFKTLSLKEPAKGDLVEEWWAMTEMNEDSEEEDDSSDRDSTSNGEDNDQSEGAQFHGKNSPSTKQLVKLSTPFKKPAIETNRLSDLEFILKLSSLEANQKIIYTDAPEEVLDAYLSFRRGSTTQSGSAPLPIDQQKRPPSKSLLFGRDSASNSPSTVRPLAQESPLTRRSKNRLPDSLI